MQSMRTVFGVLFFLTLLLCWSEVGAQKKSFYEQASKAYGRRQWAAAERLLEKELSVNETRLEAYLLLMETHRRLDDHEAAVEDLSRALLYHEGSDTLYLLRSEAWSLYAMRSMQLEPDCPHCPASAKKRFNSLDDTARGFMQEALNDAYKALSINNKSVFVLRRVAYLEYLFGNKAAACEHYQRSIELGAKEDEVLRDDYCGSD